MKLCSRTNRKKMRANLRPYLCNLTLTRNLRISVLWVQMTCLTSPRSPTSLSPRKDKVWTLTRSSSRLTTNSTKPAKATCYNKTTTIRSLCSRSNSINNSICRQYYSLADTIQIWINSNVSTLPWKMTIRGCTMNLKSWARWDKGFHVSWASIRRGMSAVRARESWISILWSSLRERSKI